MPETTLTDRAILRLSGEDVRGFLDGLVTNALDALPVWAGLLTPQGKCLFDFLVWADPDGGDDLLIDCEAEAADDLAKRLLIYRLRRPILIARDERLSVHWRRDGDAAPDPRLAALGHRWIGPLSETTSGWRAHRLSLGVCEGRAELSDLLWLECNADELNGVSFSKGCFVGQENTARMNWRAKVNRRLFVVAIEKTGGDGGGKVRVAYPELGLAVVHARIEAVPEGAVGPEWLEPSLRA